MVPGKSLKMLNFGNLGPILVSVWSWASSSSKSESCNYLCLLAGYGGQWDAEGLWEFGDDLLKVLTEGEVTFIIKQQDLVLGTLHFRGLRDFCFPGTLCDPGKPPWINISICSQTTSKSHWATGRTLSALKTAVGKRSRKGSRRRGGRGGGQQGPPHMRNRAVKTEPGSTFSFLELPHKVLSAEAHNKSHPFVWLFISYKVFKVITLKNPYTPRWGEQSEDWDPMELMRKPRQRKRKLETGTQKHQDSNVRFKCKSLEQLPFHCFFLGSTPWSVFSRSPSSFLFFIWRQFTKVCCLNSKRVGGSGNEVQNGV